MIETIPILNNAQGGKKISILKTENYQSDKNLEELCNRKSKGLYIWTHRSNIELIDKNKITTEQEPYIIKKNEHSYFIQKSGSWLKPGQYGDNTSDGKKPVDTINEYSSGQQDEIVILNIFTTETPYKIEQKAWHQNPIFSSRKNKDGIGTERISAPISEIRSELEKIIGTSNGEEFREKNISIDIRNDFFDKVVDSLNFNIKSTFAYLLHMRFAKTGFTLQLVHQLGKHDQDLVFLLFADDYTVYGSYRNWIEEKKCWGNDIKYIDSGEGNLEQQIKLCKENGIIPFIKVGSKVNDNKIKFLKNIPSNKKILFIEEADFGAWTTNNRKRSKSLDSDIIILESGTGLNKISFDRKLDHIFKLDTTDAYLIKRGIHPIPGYNKYQSDYLPFPDSRLHDINFSIMLKKFHDLLNGQNKLGLNKLFKNVKTNSEFILSFFKSALCIPDVGNVESFDFFNTRQNSFGYRNDIAGNVSLISLSSGLRNKDLIELEELLLSDKSISSKFEIMILNGDFTSRENSEEYTKGRLKEFRSSGKSVLILSSTMGKRSYSIPEIKNIFLMYDVGSEDGTAQVISRGMTEGYQYNGDVKTYFNVIGCSINPNRTEPSIIDIFLMDKIVNTLNRYNKTTEESTNLVLACFPLNIIDEFGITFNNVDSINFIKRNPKSEMYTCAAASGIKLNLLSDEVKIILENSGLKSDFISHIIDNKLDLKGLKTIIKSKQSNNNKTVDKDEKDQIIKTIKILESLIFLIESSFAVKFFLDKEGSFSIVDDLKEIKSLNLSDQFYKEYKIDIDICIYVFENGVIDSKLINASVDEKIIELDYE